MDKRMLCLALVIAGLFGLIPDAEAARAGVNVKAICRGDHAHNGDRFSLRYEISTRDRREVRLVPVLRDRSGRDWARASDSVPVRLSRDLTVVRTTIHTDRVPRGSVITIYGRVYDGGRRLAEDRCNGDPVYFR